MIAGLAGALVLNILHESVRSCYPGAPKINELGEEALRKAIKPFNISLDEGKSAYLATLCADMVSNTLYYGVTAKSGPLIPGALAGIGAVKLPRYLGLNEDPVAATAQRKLLTFSYYLIGSLVTSAVYKALNR